MKCRNLLGRKWQKLKTFLILDKKSELNEKYEKLCPRDDNWEHQEKMLAQLLKNNQVINVSMCETKNWILNS